MSATTQAKEKAQETAQQAAGEARGRVREQVDQRSTDAGRQVSGTANDARDIAQQLREQGKEGPAKLAEQAAERAEKLGDYLQNSDADRILSDVEDFGRRQPMAIMLGGLLAGFAASRFLKASSTRRHGAQYSSTGTATGRGYATTPAPAPMPPTPGVGATAPTTGTMPGAGLERERFGGDTPPVSERTGTVPPGSPARDVSLSGGVRHDGPNGPERPL
jgi:hypothetical protein